ncbi:MAG: hypothetical protein RL885_01960 [Planctomycetota bacterium]
MKTLSLLLTVTCFTFAMRAAQEPSLDQQEKQESTWVFPKTEETLEKAFEFSDPDAFRVIEVDEEPVLDLHQASKYRAAVRSPFGIALIKDVEFGSFVMTCQLMQTGREYGHRDTCLFFGFEKPTRFYYVHMASQADPNAHNIFRVEDAPRTNIAKKTTGGVKWGQEVWHDVKIERDVEKGTIRVYFDDMDEPIMIAEDKTFTWGRVGFGSFDDTGRMRNLRITGQMRRVKGDAFPKKDGEGD